MVCNEGNHRAWTAGLTLESTSNYIKLGNRQYKRAKFFTPSSYGWVFRLPEMINTCVDCLIRPHAYMFPEPTCDLPLPMQFAFDAGRVENLAILNWMNMWETVIQRRDMKQRRQIDNPPPASITGSAGSDGRRQAPADQPSKSNCKMR